MPRRTKRRGCSHLCSHLFPNRQQFPAKHSNRRQHTAPVTSAKKNPHEFAGLSCNGALYNNREHYLRLHDNLFPIVPSSGTPGLFFVAKLI